MRLIDKIYWVYKTQHPFKTPPPTINPERFLSEHDINSSLLPANSAFKPACEISISAAGDLINHPFLKHSKKTLYSDKKIQQLLFDCDFSSANLECPIIENIQQAFTFNSKTAPPLYYSAEEFDCVKGHNHKTFSFMSTACNHSLDFGETGVRSTTSTLDSNGIKHHGLNTVIENSYQPSITQVKQIRLANIAFTFGLNAHQPPEHNPQLVNVTNLNGDAEACEIAAIQQMIEGSKQQGADFIILHLHWGLEHEFHPSLEQIKLAHRLAESGADVIIGHHPHVIQPVELYQTERDPLRIVPIYYSLGNLINYFSAPWLCESRIARLVLTKGIDQQGTLQTYVKTASYLDVMQETDQANATLTLRPAAIQD